MPNWAVCEKIRQDVAINLSVFIVEIMNIMQNIVTKNKYLLLIFLAVIFALPFERIPTMEVFGFTIKISYILAVIFLATILFSGNAIKLFKGTGFSLSDKALVLFWAASLISLLWAPDLKRGVIIFALWTFIISIYFVFSRVLTSSAIRQKAENTILLVSTIVCVFGIYQFLGDSFGLPTYLTGLREAYTKTILGFPRIQSVALEPLYFANFLLIPFFISLKRYIKNDQILKPHFILSILILINIILTISRGVYIAVGLSLFLLLIYLWINRKKENYFNKMLGIIAIVIVSLLLSMALVFRLNGRSATSNFIDHAVVENTQSDGSALDRLGTYKMALDFTKDKPIFGNGLGSFGVFATPDFKKDQGIYQTVNNEYLEILSETGVTGLGLFVLFLIFLAYEDWTAYKKRDDNEKLSLTILALGCLAILVQYNFFSTLYIIYIWVFLALLKGSTLQNRNS